MARPTADFAERAGLDVACGQRKLSCQFASAIEPYGSSDMVFVCVHLRLPLRAGIGAGTKDFEKHPNILRVIVGRLSESPLATRLPPVDNIAFTATDSEGERSWIMRKLWMLETNIDDMTGEVAGYLTERLLAAGSLDAWISPAFMKKSRPAYCIHVLCEPQDQERIMRLLFEESSTLGVRRYSVERCSLRRETITTSTTYGDVRVKVINTCGSVLVIVWLIYSSDLTFFHVSSGFIGFHPVTLERCITFVAVYDNTTYSVLAFFILYNDAPMLLSQR